jgi:hypothetical protein
MFLSKLALKKENQKFFITTYDNASETLADFKSNNNSLFDENCSVLLLNQSMDDKSIEIETTTVNRLSLSGKNVNELEEKIMHVRI